MGQYAYIADLPPQIREVLSIPRQEQWLSAYHKALTEDPSETNAVTAAWRMVLSDVFEGEFDIPAMPTSTPAAVAQDGKVVSITINAAEGKTAPKLESCVMDLYNDPTFTQRYPDDTERKSHAFAICRSSLQMGEQFTYLSDLTGITFEDGTTRSWVQMLPLGSWTHPVFGPINVDAARAQRFADNVNNNVRGQKLDIDYAHKTDVAKGDKAAGWVVKAESRSDGVWGLVEWTPVAQKELSDGEWRYFSPEFQDEWIDPATDKVYRDVIFGGALTNRPFIKSIAPINLSEVIELRDISQKTRNATPKGSFAGKGTSFPILSPADVAAAAHSLGRAGADNYSSDQIKANIIRIAYSKGPAFVAKLPDDWKRKSAQEGSMDEFLKGLALLLGYDITAEDAGAQAKVLEDIKALSEYKTAHPDKDEATKKFAEEYPDEYKRMVRLEEKTRQDDARMKLQEWSQIAETKTGLPTKLHDPVRDFRLSLPDSLLAKFDEVMEAVIKTPPVDFSERGTTELDETNSEEDGFIGAVTKLQEEAEKAGKPITFEEGIKKVSKAQPELAKAWRESTRRREAN